MNKITLAASILALSAVSASAADLAYKAAPMPLPPTCVWCGFYLGGNLGGSWADNSVTYTQFTVVPTSASAKSSATSFMGGAQVGYNAQWGNFVLGFETDWAWRAGTANTHLLPFAPGNVDDQVNISNKQGWVGTFRPRAGFTFSNVLVYVTGGGAVGVYDQAYQEVRVSTGQARLTWDQDAFARTKVGWAAGGGFEWMVMPRWSVGAEYLHIDLGSSLSIAGASTSAGLAFPPSQVRYENKSDVVRVKVNYNFNSGPALAQY